MVACTPIMTSKKDALEKIQADSKDSTEIFNSNLPPTAPKVDIIQINYGADSLKNIDFLSFLAGAKVKLSSVIIENLKTQENQYLNALKKEKSPQVFLTEAIAAAKITADKDIQLAKKLNTTMTLNLSGINLSQVLEQIAKRGKIEIKSNFNGPSPQLQGVYKGTVGSVLKTIAEENKLLVYKSANLEDTLEIYSIANNTLMLMNFDSVNSALDVKKDLIILNQKYLEIFPNDGAQSNVSDHQLDVSAELKTQSVTLFLEGLINQIQISMIEKERNKHDVIGFIAQQIGEVIPEAITKTEGIVPNIYKNCSVINKREIQHSISLNVPIDTDIIITDTEDGTGERYKIKEIYDDYFVIDKDINRDEVFVKGYSINDLHNLDKNYIYTLNVCATQELHKIIVEQKNKINDLESRLLALEAIVMKII